VKSVGMNRDRVALLGVCMALSVPMGARAQAAPSYECVIEPSQVVELRSSVEGVIEKVFVKRGDRVSAGQIVAQLESSAEASAVDMALYRSKMEGRIATARNRVEFSTKKLARTVELQKQNYSAPQTREEAEAEKRIAESDLKDALENQEMARREHRHAADLLNRRYVRSPFNGVVVDRLLNPGELADAGSGRKPIMKLAQVEPLRVEVVLPLQAWGKLPVGTKATVMPEALGGRYPAVVTVSDSVFDSASGTFGVRLELTNPKGALPAGIRCKVEFSQLKGVPPPSSGGSARTAPAKP
jgi:RND family efflux transporter MFP subunit